MAPKGFFGSKFRSKYFALSLSLILLVLISNPLFSNAVLGEVGTHDFVQVSARLSSSSGAAQAIHEIPIPQNNSEPLGIMTDGQGNIWFAENNKCALVEYVPSQEAFRTFPIPTNSTAAGLIWFLIFDNNGNIWFSASSEPLLWRFSLQTLQFANFSTGGADVVPFGLALDPSTNQIWFTSTYTDQIGAFQIQGDIAALVNLKNVTGTPRPGSAYPYFGPAGIEIDPQGNIFVSEPFSGNIVEYDQTTNNFVNVWSLPPGAQPTGLALDSSSGRVWFTNHASSLFGYLDEKSGTINQFATSLFVFDGYNVTTLPYWIQQSPSGMIWFDEHIGNKIARFDPSVNQLTEFSIPTNSSSPLRFTIDNVRGVIWFTEFSGDKLGELDENQSCSCGVSLSTRSITFSGTSNSESLNLSLSNISNSFPSSPMISGSFSMTGALSKNLTISATRLSSGYDVTLSRGANLEPGNYSLTLCPTMNPSDTVTTPAPIRQCAALLLSIEKANPAQFSADYLWLVGVAVVATALGISIFYVRRWQGGKNTG